MAEPASKKPKTEGVVYPLKMAVSPFPTSDKFLRMLINTKVDSIRPPENKVFVAQRTDRVVDVWKGLTRHRFLSVPVLQKTKSKYYGFVDVYDIVRFVIEHFGETAELKNSEDFFQVAEKSEEFTKMTVNDVMKYPLSRRNPFRPVKSGYSLFTVIELLAREEGLHRVPILTNDEDRRLVTLITQSQIIKLVHQHLELLGEKKNKPVNQTSRFMKEVHSVTEDTIAMDVFKLMHDKLVSGVAVVDSAGKLVGTISVRDLKTMNLDGRLFWRLYQPVKAYLQKIRQEDKAASGDRPSRPLTVTEDAKLGDVVETLVANRLHRTFIVNGEGKPTGVIALKDILLEIITE